MCVAQALGVAQREAERQRTAAWSFEQRGKEREAELQRRVAALEEERAGLRRRCGQCACVCMRAHVCACVRECLMAMRYIVYAHTRTHARAGWCP